MLWKQNIVSPEKALARIQPGMSIFIGTGVAEPRTLLKHLTSISDGNVRDLELIQLISLGDAVDIEERFSRRFRLKTFYAGWVAGEAVQAGRVDLIPCRFSRIPGLIDSGRIRVDAAFIQISSPDNKGYVSLGVAVDAARQAMDKASLVIGEINDRIPWTLGDTTLHVDDFDYLVEATEDPIYFPRWPVEDVFDRIAVHVASVIEDGDCLGFTIGALYEALARHLSKRRHLGIHSPFFTDAVMDLVDSGAVSNRRKAFFRGKCLVSYALGTRDLMRWLDRNPLVEFQGIDVVADPRTIGLNDNYIAILPARKVDLTGGVAVHAGRANVSASPGEALEFLTGATFSQGGRIVFALPSRNLQGDSNILLSVENYPNQVTSHELLDLVATEYGVAAMSGRTVRDRALSLIDIAHPEDREHLVEKAKASRVLYADQIYVLGPGRLYPENPATSHRFNGDILVRFRPIKPSDEEEMRKLFYRFSEEAVYHRYFSPIRIMPHEKMQEYVNVDYHNVLSIVGLVGEPGAGRIIAEARYVKLPDEPMAEIAMFVDEQYQGRGIAGFMFQLLIRGAQERGIRGFTAEVLAGNKAAWRVLEKTPFRVETTLEHGVYHVTIPFRERKNDRSRREHQETRKSAGGEDGS